MRLDKLGKTDKKSIYLNEIEDLDFENLSADDEYIHDDDFDDDVTNQEQDQMDDMMDDVVFQDYYYYDDDDAYEFMEDDAMDDQEIIEVRKAKADRDNMPDEEKRKIIEDRKMKKKKEYENMRQKREQARNDKMKKAESSRHARESHRRTIQQRKTEDTKKMQMGKALEKTYTVREDGWYRFCVEATHNNVEAEFEFRKSSQLGAPNKKTGHLQTYERHDMTQNERKLMEKLSLAAKNGGAVKEEDLTTTKNQITKMNRLLNEIREKQVNERHRLSIHKAVNDHSHSRMVVGSLFETVFYIVVSGFQVYTIRKWFTGSPILGY